MVRFSPAFLQNSTQMPEHNEIVKLLGADADSLLNFKDPKISKDLIHLPHRDWVYRAFADSDRNPRVLVNLQRLYGTGRLKNTGYLSILPVDQGIEHSAGASFAKNKVFFDPENIINLAIEGGCNAVCSTFGVLGILARKYAHKIPFMVKINHNQLLTYPNQFDEVLFGTVKQAYDMGAAAIGATIYFGSPESNRQIQEVSRAFAIAHEYGLATVLWCYLRNPAFNDKDNKKDYHVSADLTGQANHLGVTIQADIIKQKLPENNGGYLYVQSKDKGFGKTDKRVYDELTAGDHPIDLARYQVANCYLGRAGLINSGGASGSKDFEDAVKTAVINKRAGGQGLISGRKAFQRLPADGNINKAIDEGAKLLNIIQDVYLDKEITVA
jgi:class I fructose-bisphosphate aldolase